MCSLVFRRRILPNLSAPNARHHPPRTQLSYGQALRMTAALFAVGCMPLLDAASIWEGFLALLVCLQEFITWDAGLRADRPQGGTP
jgi:hypothetical protein